MKYNWDKSVIEQAVIESDSLTETLLKMNIPRLGNNSKTLRSKIEEYNIDISHFTYGAIKKRGKENYIPVSNYLGTNKFITSSTLKEKLFKEGLKKNECENPKCLCKGGYWLDNPLICQLHHINGNPRDNRLENLQILCPNCHSLTDNYCGSANSVKRYFCSVCGKEITRGATYCQECAAKKSRKVARPTSDQLLEAFKEIPNMTLLAKSYGVTDNTVRKWLKAYNLPFKVKDLLEYIK